MGFRSRTFLVWSLLCVCTSAFAKNSAYYQFRHGAASPVCKERLDHLTDLHSLFEMNETSLYLRTDDSLSLQKKLATFSTDFLIKVSVELDQEYEVLCPEHKKASALREQLNRAYLGHLGILSDSLKSEEVDKLFRGLLAFKAEIAPLKQQLAALKPAVVGADDLLPRLFGNVRKLSGVPVFGASPAQFEHLSTVVGELCKASAACLFWDPKLVYKVVVRDQPGTALYVPEVAVLVLSSDLLDKPNLLHRLVIAHELAHVAAQGAWVFRRQDWVGDYAKVGGWKKDAKGKWSITTRRLAGTRDDALTQLSKNSRYSILPDTIYVSDGSKEGQKAKTEGFVLAKSYEESLKNNDPSEDFADHVATFFYMPERFCYQGNNIAPGKYAWIGEKVFQQTPALECPTS